MRSVLAFIAPYDSTWVSLDAMATIKEIQADHYRIPLPVALSDSTHGTIAHFELVTARVRDADGAEGVGYTYTVGAGGAAIHALLARELAPLLVGHDAERIEALWQTMWWALHYVGRGGAAALAISAVDIALWDLRARRQGTPLWRLLGGFDPRVPCYAGGIDLEFPLDALLRQTDDNLGAGLPRDQDEGGPAVAARGRRAGAGDARAPRPRLPADGRRQHALERGRGDPRRARARRPTICSGSRSRRFPTTCPGHARIVREGGVPIAAGENLHTLYEFRAADRRRRRHVPRARRHELRRRDASS